MNELQLVQLGNGSVMAVMRNDAGSHRQAVAISSDGGETFGPIRMHPDLITPVCQMSVLYIRKSTILYAGPRSTTERVNMTVLASDDDGVSFTRSLQVLPGTSYAGYSSMQFLGGKVGGVPGMFDGEVMLLFERGGQGVHYDGGNTSVVRFNEADIKSYK